MSLSTRRILLACSLALVPLSFSCDAAEQCAAEGEDGRENGCCDGLARDFTGTCRPCVPAGEEIMIDGPGCCEGLSPGQSDGICDFPSTDNDTPMTASEATSGAGTSGNAAPQCVGVGGNCSLVDCCDGYRCVDAADEEQYCLVRPTECSPVGSTCIVESDCCEGLECMPYGDFGECVCPDGDATGGECEAGTGTGTGT